MSVSPRKTIREAIRKILLNKTDAGARVYTNRASLAWSEQMPDIVIYQKSVDVNEYAVAPRELEHVIEMAIEITAAGNEQPVSGEEECGNRTEDILDEVARQVECEMSRDDTLLDTADNSILTGIEFDFRNEGEQPIGSARLTYAVTYYEHSPISIEKQTQINLKDFKNASVDWDIVPQDEIIEAEDELEIPQE